MPQCSMEHKVVVSICKREGKEGERRKRRKGRRNKDDRREKEKCTVTHTKKAINT